jgi:hypothetical protein
MISWNLYGERDFAKHVVSYDRAVQERCEPADDCEGPFFEERTLPDRIRAVLNSLKVDTEDAAT